MNGNATNDMSWVKLSTFYLLLMLPFVSLYIVFGSDVISNTSGAIVRKDMGE